MDGTSGENRGSSLDTCSYELVIYTKNRNFDKKKKLILRDGLTLLDTERILMSMGMSTFTPVTSSVD